MSNWRPIIPVPDGVKMVNPRHPLGDPSAGWEYLNPQDRLLQIICRFDHKDKDGEPTKTFLPLTYCENENGERVWRWQALPAPRPLYGLDRLAARPDAPVLVCEGEKSADAAALLFSDFVTITSPNGCKAANAADWAPLTGRHVTVWPDHDKSGRNYAADVSRLALTAGAVEVRVVAVPDDFPRKWDLGDFFSPREGLELPEGWDAVRLRSLLDAAVPVSAVSGEKKSPATGGKPRLNDEEARAEIARLAKLDAVAYMRAAPESAKNIGISRNELDRLVEPKRKERPRQTDNEAKAARDTARLQCKDLMLKPDILADMVKTLQASGLVGEERAIKLIYLAVTSRLLQRIVSAAIKGPSSGGKSFIVERVISLFPPNAVHVLTSMSERALAYGDEPLAHRMLVIYEAAGLASEFGSYLVRSLLSEGRICYETVENTAEGLRPRRIEREGPTGLITTTTANQLHPENETRLLSITITDTNEQTRAILRAQAQHQGRIQDRDSDVAPWRALQQFIALGPVRVTIPFNEKLADLVSPVAVRLRRDFPVVLSLIEAHALLHQASREKANDGAIVATIEQDYAPVHELVANLVSEGADATVAATVRETVNAVTALAKKDGNGVSITVSITELAAHLKLDKAAASRRAKIAIKRGLLRNEEERKGRPARLVLGDPLPAEISVLPSPDTLAKCCSVDHETGGIGPKVHVRV